MLKISSKGFRKQCGMLPTPRQWEGALFKQETRVPMVKKQIKYNHIKIQFLFTIRHPYGEKKKVGHIKPIKDSYSK